MEGSLEDSTAVTSAELQEKESNNPKEELIKYLSQNGELTEEVLAAIDKFEASMDKQRSSEAGNLYFENQRKFFEELEKAVGKMSKKIDILDILPVILLCYAAVPLAAALALNFELVSEELVKTSFNVFVGAGLGALVAVINGKRVTNKFSDWVNLKKEAFLRKETDKEIS